MVISVLGIGRSGAQCAPYFEDNRESKVGKSKVNGNGAAVPALLHVLLDDGPSETLKTLDGRAPVLVESGVA